VGSLILRRLAAAGLFLAAGVMLFTSIFLLYGRVTLFSPERFSDRAVSTLQQPEVREAVSQQIVDRIVAEGDPDLVAVRPLLISVTESVVQTNAFEKVFRQAVVQAHASVFEGDRDTLVLLVSNAVVLVGSALEKLNPEIAKQIPKGAAASIIRLSDSSELHKAAEFARNVRRGAVVTLLVGLLALVGAVALSINRFRAIRTAGVVVAGGALLVLLLDELVESRLIGQTSDSLVPAAEQAYEVMTDPLRQIAFIYLASGLVMVAATIAVTRPRDLENSIASLARPFVQSVTAPATTRLAWLGRAAAALLIGIVFVARPTMVLEIIVVVVGILLLAQAVRDLTAAIIGPERLADEAAVERSGGKRAFAWLAAGFVAVILAGAALGTWVTGSQPLSQVIGPGTRCNGDEALCERPLTAVTLAATHNSMSAADDRDWFFPEQNRGIVSQLDNGVRGLLFDVYYGYPGRRVKSYIDLDDPGTKTDAIRSFGPEFVAAAQRLQSQIAKPEPGARKELYMCHGFCELGALPLVPTLTQIRKWMDQNPREVVMMVVEDYVPPEAIIGAFDKSGLDHYAYGGPITANIPTLASLIRADRRLIVYGENIDRRYEWYRPAFDDIQETPFKFDRPSAMNCKENRGDADNPLFLVNHWIATPPASLVSNARRVNGKNFVLDRARRCIEERTQHPNLIAVDWYREGNITAAVKKLNESPPAPTDATTTR
jgi:hypothetical protein